MFNQNVNLSNRNRFDYGNTNIKLIIKEYYESLINLVDIDAETLLIKLATNQEINNQESIIEINKSREYFMNQINKHEAKLVESSIKNLKVDLDKIKREDLFTESCFYLERDLLDNYRYNNDQLGLLIFSNFYISDEEWNNFKSMLLGTFNLVTDNTEDRYVPKKNIMICSCWFSEIANAIKYEKSIVHLNSSIYEEIVDVELDNLDFSHLDEDIDYFKNLEYVTLKGKKILARKNIEKVKSLRIDSSELANESDIIDKNSFIHFPNLTSLNLIDNGLTKLPSFTFTGLKQLKKMYLNNNSINIIEDDAFSGLENLETLCLCSNKLTKLTAKTFSGLKNLKTLRLDDNKELLDTDNQTFEHLTHLESIHLDVQIIAKQNTNEIKAKWPNLIDNLKNLHVSCDYGQVDQIFEYNFKCLERLDLGNFKLTNQLPKEANTLIHLALGNYTDNIFKNLSNLKGLKLRNFTIKSENEHFYEYNHLKSLDSLSINFENWNANNHKFILKLLNSNNGGLVPRVGNLKKLKICQGSILFLNKNVFDKMNNLKTLDLSGNHIDYLSVYLFNKNLTNLTMLDIFDNNIRFIRKNHFEQLTNLRHLNLADNKIESIEADSFHKLNNLEFLILSGNKINYIHEAGFRNLIRLRHLELGWNKIKKLTSTHFLDLKQLMHIDLSENCLESIDGVFKNLKFLKLIILNHNRLSKINLLEFLRFEYLRSILLVGNDSLSINRKEMSILVNLNRINIHYDWLDRPPFDDICKLNHDLLEDF